ncbi:MAG TPA: hypothetical protein VJZ76_08370 [Thermoanaerobaculia bacterium]|nr:hypothetical protein [Thermoanaerobaculia bacterium]
MTPNNRFAAIALTVALAVPAAEASMATAAPFEEKVDNANSIIVGRCLKNESRWDPSGRWILTYSTFKVTNTLKGSAAQEVTLVVPGGSIGGVHQSSVGLPAFSEGSENVLFIRNSKVGPTVLYFDQGAYDVKTNDRGEKVVEPVATDVVHIDAQRGVAVPGEGPRSLSEFKGAVDRAVRTADERRQKMDLIRARQQKGPSIGSMIIGNKLVLAALAIGLLLAAWQLFRR